MIPEKFKWSTIQYRTLSAAFARCDRETDINGLSKRVLKSGDRKECRSMAIEYLRVRGSIEWDV